MSDRINIDAGARTLGELSAWSKPGDSGPVLDFEQPARLKTILGRHLEKRLVVRLELDADRRSNQANKYLWGGVYADILQGLREMYAEGTERCPFQRAEDVHSAMKYLVLGEDVFKVGETEIRREVRTNVMTSEQFSKYVSRVKEIAAERWKIYVREPGE